MIRARRKFDLYLEPSYEVLTFRVLDSNGSPVLYLNRIKGTNTVVWLPEEKNPFKMMSDRIRGNLYMAANQTLITLAKEDYNKLKDILTYRYNSKKYTLEVFSNVNKEGIFKVEMDI